MADESETKFAEPSTAALLAELQGESAKPADGKPAEGAADEADPDDPDAATPDDEDDEDEDPASEATSEEDPEEDDEEKDDDPDDDDDDEDEEPADDLATKDPELAKRLRVIRQTEHRQREALKRDREAFDRERSEWQAQVRQFGDAQKRFEQLAARAKYDPGSVLAALGLSEDDMVYAAQQVYARSKKAASDPNHRAAAERAMRDREQADQLAEARREIKELKEGLTAQQRQAAEDQQIDAYLARVTRKAGDETPITKQLIANRPKAARRELLITANELAGKLGRLPKTKELLAAHERKEARALRLRGITPPAAPSKPDAAGKSTGTKPAKPAAAKPAAAVEVQPDDPKNIKIPSRDELLKELQSAN